MKVLVLVEGSILIIQERPILKPKPGEVIIKVYRSEC